MTRLGRLSEARFAQSSAREHLSTVTAWAIRAELRYHESCFHYVANEDQRSYDLAESAERDIAAYYEHPNHDVKSVSLTRADLMNIKAIVNQNRGHHAVASTLFMQAVKIGQSRANFDVGSQARLLSNLTSLMNGQDDRDSALLEFVQDATARIPWTVDLAHEHFCVLRETGYAFSSVGRFTKALELFRAAAHRSATPVDKLLSAIDCIIVLVDLGFARTASAKLAAVDKALQHDDLSACKERDAHALLRIAEHVAPVDVRRARSLYSTYLSLKSSAPRTTNVFTDERMLAYQFRFESALAAATGDLRLSGTFLRQAFENFDRLSMQREAGRVALDLAKLESGDRYRLYALDVAKQWPLSSFAVKAWRDDGRAADGRRATYL